MTLTVASRAAQALALSSALACSSAEHQGKPSAVHLHLQAMSADTCDVRVQSSPEPQERHSSSPPCKGSQRCISIHANVDAASSGLMELVHGQVHATSHGISQNISMRAPQGSCGVVYDAVMELHIREGEGSHCTHFHVLPASCLERATQLPDAINCLPTFE